MRSLGFDRLSSPYVEIQARSESFRSTLYRLFQKLCLVLSLFALNHTLKAGITLSMEHYDCGQVPTLPGCSFSQHSGRIDYFVCADGFESNIFEGGRFDGDGIGCWQRDSEAFRAAFHGISRWWTSQMLDELPLHALASVSKGPTCEVCQPGQLRESGQRHCGRRARGRGDGSY